MSAAVARQRAAASAASGPGTAIAAAVACAASMVASPTERGRRILDALQELVPFVACELATFDPWASEYAPLVHEGYSGGVLKGLNSQRMQAECAELGILRSGRPARMRDVPAGASAHSGTIGRLLAPSGFAEGLTMCLRTPDGRNVGLLHLSVEDARHPTDDACAVLHELNPALANVCDATQGARWLQRLAVGSGSAVGLDAAGRPVALADVHRSAALEDGSPLLAAVARLLPALSETRRALWVEPDGGAVHDVRVIPHREPGDPRLAVLVTAEPRTDVHELTHRELEVLTFFAQGLSNDAIAARLVISSRTVGKHAEHVLHKLDVPTRAAAAAYAVTDGLLLLGTPG